MKQTFNIMAEVMALPFTHCFIEKDPFEELIERASSNTQNSMGLLAEISKRMGTISSRILRYVSSHTEVNNLAELQDTLAFVFRPEEIIGSTSLYKKPCPKMTAFQFYLSHLFRLAKTFLSNRDGKITFKYWQDEREGYDCRGIEGSKFVLRDLLGGNLSTGRAEVWHSLMQCMPSDLLISAYCVLLSMKTVKTQRADACVQLLMQFGDTVHLADTMLEKVLEKGMAETHMHAGASRSFSMVWSKLLQDVRNGHPALERNYALPYKTPVYVKDFDFCVREALTVKTLLIAFLSQSYLAMEKGLASFLHSNVIPLHHAESLSLAADYLIGAEDKPHHFSESAQPLYVFLDELNSRQHSPMGRVSYDGFSEIGLEEKVFQAFALLYQIDFPEDVLFSSVFFYYIRLKNQVYRMRVQDSKNRGLEYFQKYYDISTDTGRKTPDESLNHIIVTAINDARMKKTELRVKPPTGNSENLSTAVREAEQEIKKQISQTIRQHIYVLIRLYGKNDREAKSFSEKWRQSMFWIGKQKQGELKKLVADYHVPLSDVPDQRIGLVYHFIKYGETLEDAACFSKNTFGSDQSKYMMFSFGKARYRYEVAVKALHNVRSLSPEVSRIVVGIDAASLEIPTEPWVFAPAFRIARSLNAQNGATLYPNEKRLGKGLLGITYHVGEDFRHPLSGLRHISEAMRFFRFHTGDRLGHALAMCIDLNNWFQAHTLTPLPIVEWLENCLWAWNVMSNEWITLESSKYIRYLETEILKCARRIYGTLDGITIEKLWKAYNNKTLDLQSLMQIREDVCSRHNLQSNDCFLEYNDLDSFYPCNNRPQEYKTVAWDENTLSLSYHCTFFKHRMMREILLENAKDVSDLSKLLQEYVRKESAKLGVIVETNPSSNATIGEMNGIMFHPIQNIRRAENPKARVMATINTDDPSVFNATVANEHANVYYALLYNGYTVEEALQQVDGIRQLGLDSSFLESPCSLEQLLDEYEEILRVIM